MNTLESRIWTQKPEYRIGEPVIVHYELRNAGPEPVAVWHSGFWPNHLVQVFTEDGKEVALTQAGIETRRAFENRGERCKNVPFELKPGKIDGGFEPVDVTRYFDLRKPGRYRIIFVYDEQVNSPRTGRVTSNPVTVTITD